MQNSIKKNAIYNIVKTVSSIVFPLITFPYISRVLLPDNVGKIHFGLSVISYFTLIATLGITTHAIRECAAVKNDRNKLNNTSSQIFSINLITTFIAYLALAIVLLLFRRLDNYRLIIIIQSFAILATTLGADWINSATEDFGFITMATVSFQVIAIVLMFVFVKEPNDYLKYVVISLAASSGANIVNIFYRARICKTAFTFKIDLKKHLVPIILLFVMILAQTIFTNVDVLMLGLQIGDWEVGIYSTANKLYAIVLQVVTSLMWVVLPRLTNYFLEKKYDEISKLLRKVLAFNALLGLPCAVGCFMMSKEIILIAAGNDYVESVPVLKILMIGFVFTVFGGGFIGNAVLLPAKKEKLFMIVCCITAVVNVVTNYVFIPRFGAKAAAGTTSFCAFLILVLLLPFWDKKIRIERKLKVFLTPVTGCIGIVLTCLLFQNIPDLWLRTALSIMTSAIVYFTILLIGKNELLIELLIRIKKKVHNQA